MPLSSGRIALPGPIAGAKEACTELAKSFDVLCFTTRKPALVLQWLKDNDMEGIFSDVTNEKRPYIVLIDDRAIRFNGEWNEKLIGKILNFNTYWEEDQAPNDKQV